MKKAKNLLKYIASVFLVILVSLSIYTFVVTDIMKKDYVNVFGYSYFVVASGSMSGTIEVDDIIFVRLTKKVKPNDIITFKNKDNDIITHRLIRKDGEQYITKGDVNNVTDEIITKEQIVGKVQLIVSPSFILKSIAAFLIIFIFLALINFDGIIQKYIIKEGEVKGSLPDDLFTNPNRKEDPPSGMTVTIALDDVENIDKAHEKELEKKENIEILDFPDYLFEEDVPNRKKEKKEKEKETINLVISIFKCKRNSAKKAKMTKKWLIKYQYIYKLCHLLLLQNTETFIHEIENPPFDEIYDYELDQVGLTETMRNHIYSMPIYVFLRLLTYAVLYNDDEMFDGIYKILKYKVMIDEDNYFREIAKANHYAIKQIKALIAFMQKISNQFDRKNVFELDKIERMAKIGSY